MTTVHTATNVDTVTLKVANLQQVISFYTKQIGLQLLQQAPGAAVLGAGQQAILRLEEVPGAHPPHPQATGLYHAAILFPDRRALALKVGQLMAQGHQLGQADHWVSEAFYLNDPEGNGLELYRDRPRQEWQWAGDKVQMGLDPVDFDSLFDGISERDLANASPTAPDGTRLGHIHLRVSDLSQAEQFYVGVLGMEVTAHMPSALFVAAGGYHHHFGLNTWHSRGGPAPAADATGLREFSLVVPDRDELGRIVQRASAAGALLEHSENDALLQDPFQNRIRTGLSPAWQAGAP